MRLRTNKTYLDANFPKMSAKKVEFTLGVDAILIKLCEMRRKLWLKNISENMEMVLVFPN